MQEMEPKMRVNSKKIQYSTIITLILGILFIVIGLLAGFYSALALTFNLMWPMIVLHGGGNFLIGVFFAKKQEM